MDPRKYHTIAIQGMIPAMQPKMNEVQSVFVPHLRPTQFCLDDDVANILRHQMDFLLTGLGPNDYTELREVLLNE